MNIMRVKLKDVADCIKGNEDRLVTKLPYYLGGEHYESGSIAIYDKGLIHSDEGRKLGFKFHFPFQKGDTIFMARNPHLKKAGMASARTRAISCGRKTNPSSLAATCRL